jgi:hypothetical protein
MSKCPITRAISRLKQFAGMPVPAIVKWVDGKPDFRDIDHATYIKHYRYKLCAVCGTKLGLSCYWIGGGACKDEHYFVDGPMHEKCAELSIRWCPFLNKTKPTYRGTDLQAMPVQDASSRPDKMYLMRGVTSAIEWHRLGDESLALWAGKQLTVVREF